MVSDLSGTPQPLIRDSLAALKNIGDSLLDEPLASTACLR